MRQRISSIPTVTQLAVGPELGAALDADLSDSVVLRLASTVLSWGDPPTTHWSTFVGVAPRAELRIQY